MRLDDLAKRLGARLAPADAAGAAAAGSVRVSDVSHDSRDVGHGDLFACIPGGSADGHAFTSEAVAAGAAALLVQRTVQAQAPQLLVTSVRQAVGEAAAAVHGDPCGGLDLVGVTGTNGKTTTVRLIAGLLRAAGRDVSEIGTLTGTRTTPEATDLQRQLAQAVSRGDHATVMEVSSHSLAQHRVDGCRFRLAVFTNLSRDHLDFHETMDEYFKAKARLFTPDLSEQAVINVTSQEGRRLARAAAAQMPVVEVDTSSVELIEAGASCSLFRWRGLEVRLSLGASFNVSNAVLAAEAAVALGLSPESAAAALAHASVVPGRFEAVRAGQDFAVIVDYAHTPDGLEAVLRAARDITKGRLTVVFGAGGDRDRGKRPQMGAAAAKFADRVVVTSDNPRSEDPEEIIKEIVGGVRGRPYCVDVDRRLAVRHAVAGAESGDTVVIAGKGHETGQTIGARTAEFDDRIVAREEIMRRGKHGGAPEHRA